MKQLILPKIPAATRKNHHIVSTRQNEDDDRASEVSLLIPEDNVSSAS